MTVAKWVGLGVLLAVVALILFFYVWVPLNTYSLIYAAESMAFA